MLTSAYKETEAKICTPVVFSIHFLIEKGGTLAPDGEQQDWAHTEEKQDGYSLAKSLSCDRG